MSLIIDINAIKPVVDSVFPQNPLLPGDSTPQVLHTLSMAALSHPYDCLQAAPSVFLDIICRWLDQLHNHEAIVSALSQLIAVYPPSLPVLEHFFDLYPLKREIVLQWGIYGWGALFRLVKHPRFNRLISEQILPTMSEANTPGTFINAGEGLLVIREFVRKITSEVLHLPPDLLVGGIARDELIVGGVDWGFFEESDAVAAAATVEALSSTTEVTEASTENKNLRTINPDDLCRHVVPIYGELVFVAGRTPTATATATAETVLVPTAPAVETLTSLARNTSLHRPTMLVGPAGSGKTFLFHHFAQTLHQPVVKIHLGDQTDAKLLIGTYASGDRPGTFVWRPGVLTTAVRTGKWVLVEDIDRAPTDVLSVLLTLVERRQMVVPSRGEIIDAHANFRIVSTITSAIGGSSTANTTANGTSIIGQRLWNVVPTPSPTPEELYTIIDQKFPPLRPYIPQILDAFHQATALYGSTRFAALNRGARPRPVSVRDLMKLCGRCCDLVVRAADPDAMFQEAIDCFGSALANSEALEPLVAIIGAAFEVPTSRIDLHLAKHVPTFAADGGALRVGRALVPKNPSTATRSRGRGTSTTNSNFARTNHSLRLMEQIGVAVSRTEPVLLVGETGTGKTTVVQEMALAVNTPLTVINLSQQTEALDLVGGFKPITAKQAALPVQERFDELFAATFLARKNERFRSMLTRFFNRGEWKKVVRLWREAIRMVQELDSGATGTAVGGEGEKSTAESDVSGTGTGTGSGTTGDKRTATTTSDASDSSRGGSKRRHHGPSWTQFSSQVDAFAAQLPALTSSLVFSYAETPLVRAVRQGHWLLLDEINLAAPDTLDAIADLLADAHRSILLAERGDTDPVPAHPSFRVFGCMNPSTDVGKRDLPPGIRSRFTELYVAPPDGDWADLVAIVSRYVGRLAVSDETAIDDAARLYREARFLADSHAVVDGAGHRAHFSVRTLARALTYAADIAPAYGLRRAIYEGFCMAFLTALDRASATTVEPKIAAATVARLGNTKSVLATTPPAPRDDLGRPAPHLHVQFGHYWLRRGPIPPQPQPNYIITPFVRRNLLNLVRAALCARYPVLLQGPTSAGKTSMVRYLAAISGHHFVRINNHEHTDLQEYLGAYVSDDTGRLVFREGVLVDAVRHGHWIVLDELNLASTDVLEALNRLLDDNRELVVPETGEVVRPHREFMLFATQNPPGIYGGRKQLSRAFRNRFVELHFDDIPRDELEVILRDRCRIAPSYAAKIVRVYGDLALRRSALRVFEKHSLATLRDLFRWAGRDAGSWDELAAHGFMLLGERCRNVAEKMVVKEVIESVMRVAVVPNYRAEEFEAESHQSLHDSATTLGLAPAAPAVIWTNGLRRLATLVHAALSHNEPVLLVGETGCGKTSVVQVLAQYLRRNLAVVNAHQNTETADLLGAQRPVRNRNEAMAEARLVLVRALAEAGAEVVPESAPLEQLISQFETVRGNVSPTTASAVSTAVASARALFEWHDGPLVQAMKNGSIFLLDEISLADDSVLERLNSVLEPERSLLLAEADGSEVVAQPSFQFLATMNPGGDYGKKELSPALRNRFTEIWVPSMDDWDDVALIVGTKLHSWAQAAADAVVNFVRDFGNRYGGATSGAVSLRDTLAWVEFINTAVENGTTVDLALLHGAAMVFIDGLGTNATSYLTGKSLVAEKQAAVARLGTMSHCDFGPIYREPAVVSTTTTALTAGPFSIPRRDTAGNAPFVLDAPTTATNAARVVRALQVHKPVLLEGPPGVGKTSLIGALAAATGNPLVRINLSEHTDLVDLFGADAPAQDGAAGRFSWQDAPFLRAMWCGHWVLLDEMNLASQSVLEGLNACLDHRGRAYVPELDREFECHRDFTVFAAQNPQSQGGGRKGLPKSFVNRFSVVHTDVLGREDLQRIGRKLYRDMDVEVVEKVIDFVVELDRQVGVKFGFAGGPWEFNLRDSLRWLKLAGSGPGDKEGRTGDNDASTTVANLFPTIIALRFRDPRDRAAAAALFTATVASLPSPHPFFRRASNYVQAGSARLPIDTAKPFYSGSTPVLQCNFPAAESIIHCVNHQLPVILAGPSASGKTELVRLVAAAAGAPVVEFAMNGDIDGTDILGGYEQVDPVREVSMVAVRATTILRSSARDADATAARVCYDAIAATATERDAENLSRALNPVVEALESVAPDRATPLRECVHALAKLAATNNDGVRFLWFDGLVVKAVESGSWLVLDNANLCSPSVLDRLNSLLEENGSLMMNECPNPDGLPRIVTPAPGFQLFVTMDPRYGELSRAMRNRSIEIYLDALDDRMTDLDREIVSGRSAWGRASSHYPALADTARRGAVVEFPSVASAFVPWSDIDGEVGRWAETWNEEFLSTTKALAVAKGFGGNSSTEFIHPAANGPGTGSGTSSQSIDATLALESCGAVVRADQMLAALADEATSGNASNLSYLARSAAVALGRSVRRSPKLPVYSIVVAVATVVRALVRPGANFSAVLELDAIWHELVDASTHGHETRLRVARDMVVEWAEENVVPDEARGDLDRALTALGPLLELKSGHAMAILWNQFLTRVPQTAASWAQYEALGQIFAEFDAMAAQQPLSAMPTLVGLVRSLVPIRDAIFDDEVSDEEFIRLAADLRHGMDAVSGVSSTRNNRVSTQFSIIAVLVDLAGGFKGVVPPHLAMLALRPTSKFVTENKVLAERSPNLGSLRAMLSHDNMVQMITDDSLVVAASTSANGIGRVPGKALTETVGDVSELGRTLAVHSAAITAPDLRSVLVLWIENVAVTVGAPVVLSHEQYVVSEEVDGSDTAPSVVDAVERYFIPALNSNDLGRAFVLFAAGALHLYVPNEPVDPAIDRHVSYNKYLRQKQWAESLISAWNTAESVLSGTIVPAIADQRTYLESTYSEGEAPPTVYRDPAVPMEPLHEEWRAFMDSAGRADRIESLLAEALAMSPESDRLVEMLHHNADQFCRRLDRQFSRFADLNHLVHGYVAALRIGLDLVRAQNTASSARLPAPLWNEPSAIAATSAADLDALVDAGLLFVARQSPDYAVADKLVVFMVRVLVANGRKLTDAAVGQCFEAVHARWTARELKRAHDAAQEGSIYRDADQDADVEREIRALFPQYDDENEIAVTNRVPVEDIYRDLADTFVRAAEGNTATLDQLVHEGAELRSKIDNSTEFGSNSNTSGGISGVIIAISDAVNTFSGTGSGNNLDNGANIDFYRDSSPQETTRSVDLVVNLAASNATILAQWPDHATLQDIDRICHEFLDLPADAPVARRLQKIEQLLTYVAQWQKYASSAVSQAESLSRLTDVIVSWRRLELSTWQQLFRHEDTAATAELGRWWFHLYSVIGQETDPTAVVAALNVFLSQTSVGQFAARVELVAAFGSMLDQQSDHYTAVANVVSFYRQFGSAVEEGIATKRRSLERQINDVIRLASWKDVNIDALKQSARRSHASLYKVVRAYRSVLGESVGPIVEKGVPSRGNSVGLRSITAVESMAFDPEVILRNAQRAPGFASRPARLKDVAALDRNMARFVSQVARDRPSSFHSYVQLVVDASTELQRDTPSVYSDDTKSQIAALKQQKTKLLTETLKELRSMGLRTTTKPDVASVQSSSNLMLAISVPFGGNLVECDRDYFRIIDLLPRVRANVGQPSDDLPPDSVAAGFAVAQNMVYSLMVARKPVAGISHSVDQLAELHKSAAVAALALDSENQLLGEKSYSIKSSVDGYRHFVLWIPRMVEFSRRALDAVALLSHDDVAVAENIITAIENKGSAITGLFQALDGNIIDSSYETALMAVESFQKDVESLVHGWTGSTAFVGKMIGQWCGAVHVTPHVTESSLSSLEEVDTRLQALTHRIMISVQRCRELVPSAADDWFTQGQRFVLALVRATQHEAVMTELTTAMAMVNALPSDTATLATALALVALALPAITHYIHMTTAILDLARTHYQDTSRGAYTLLATFNTLLTQGFCSPQETKDESTENLEGTGLGGGQADNTTEDADADFDEDQMEKEKEENDDKNDNEDNAEEEEKDNAQDGDIDGDMEDASDQSDQENDDLDEEVDDINDMDVNEVDEKMWEGDNEEEKEKEAEKGEGQKGEDEKEGEKDDAQEPKDDAQDAKDDAKEEGDDVDDADDAEDGSEGEEEQGQDDTVKNEEGEQMDDIEQQEALELPEDMNLDGDSDGDSEGDSGEEEERGDEMDMEDEEKEGDDADDAGDDADDGVKDENEEQQLGEDEQKDTEMEPEVKEEGDEEMGEENEEKEEKENEEKEEEEEEEKEESKESQPESQPESNDQEESNEQESNEQGDQADDNQNEFNADSGQDIAGNEDPNQDKADPQTQGTDPEAAEESPDKTPNDSTSKQSQGEESHNPQVSPELKQLGDALKEFHRRHQEIKPQSESTASENPQEFEHNDDENADTQAMGSSDVKQSIDEDKAIDGEGEEDNEAKPEETGDNVEDMEDVEGEGEGEGGEEIGNEAKEGKEDKEAEDEDEEENKEKEEEQEDIDEDIDEEMDESDDDIEEITENIHESSLEDLDASRTAWNQSVLDTQELSSRLCEQLRLILEPTLATKLKGDYKTGKRLNMKRIIPYIASDFRKDKIWLRRTRPSKRQYQIMIAVDDSKSMSEGNVSHLAFNSIALVCKALTQLESGGLSVVKFGENVDVVHGFDTPFTNESGAQIFNQFHFQQTKTDIKKLCSKSVEMFETIPSDLWRLQIILSDGVCEDHHSIRQLVRRARESRIMLVFVIVDGINNESILDMSQVKYDVDNNGGSVLKVEKYLDEFPFEFYVVVKEIRELPEMLATILRQYFVAASE